MCEFVNFIETTCDHGDIRLTPANSNTFGLVEICNQNMWGTVCGNQWDNSDAAVACRQLGHSPNGAQSGTQYSLGDTWLDNVRCTGSEDRLIDCPASPIREYSNCEDWRNVAVICVPNGMLISDVIWTTLTLLSRYYSSTGDFILEFTTIHRRR